MASDTLDLGPTVPTEADLVAAIDSGAIPSRWPTAWVNVHVIRLAAQIPDPADEKAFRRRIGIARDRAGI